jgi:hypothetical protein
MDEVLGIAPAEVGAGADQPFVIARCSAAGTVAAGHRAGDRRLQSNVDDAFRRQPKLDS